MVGSDQSLGDFCAPLWLRSARGWLDGATEPAARFPILVR